MKWKKYEIRKHLKMAESYFVYTGSDFSQTMIPESRRRTWKDVKRSLRNFLASIGMISRER